MMKRVPIDLRLPRAMAANIDALAKLAGVPIAHAIQLLLAIEMLKMTGQRVMLVDKKKTRK